MDLQELERRSPVENGLDLKVNRLPVRTWNRLKMNEARLERIAAGEGPACLFYTSDAADDLLCGDLGGRRVIKKKKQR